MGPMVTMDKESMQKVRDGNPPKIAVYIDGQWHYWEYVGPKVEGE